MKNNKKTILCLHGYANSSEMFKPLKKYLERKYRLLTLDFPMNNNPLKIENIESLADFVDRFVQKIGLEKFILIGFSLGGLTAIKYAYKYNNRLEKLYLLNSFPQLLTSNKEMVLYKSIKPLLISKKFCKLYSFLKSNKKIKQSPVSILGTMFNILDIQLTDEFKSLSMEKTIVLFKDDKILRLKRYERYLNFLNCKVVLFDKGGHADNSDYWKNIKSLF